MHKQSNLVVLGGLTFATVVAGVALVNPGAKAAQQATAHASVTVQSTCSMTATVNTAHNATLFSGTYSGSSYPDGIGKTTIQTFCNDLNGYSIYAIGYTNNELGNTVLKGTDLSSEYDIVTGTATSGSVSNDVSNWAMKISAVSGTYAPTIVNGFGSFSAVPSNYTKVATLTSATDSSEGTNIGSSIETTYAAYIARLQPAGTYSGQVRYALVHPSSPETQSDYVLQNIAEWENELLPGVQYSATDARDGSVYTVSLLKDGKIWLLDNLALDLTDPTVKANLSAANTNASDTTLGYLKGTISRDPATDASGNYATAGVANWTSSYSYSAPLIATSGTGDNGSWTKDTLQSYGSGSGKIGVYYNYCAASAGSYCYGNGTSEGTSSGNATEDICPKGWRMPTGGSSGEYQALYTAYSSNDTNFKNALRTPLSGLLDEGWAFMQGSDGFFWSSTYLDSWTMYDLYVDSSVNYPPDVHPQHYTIRKYGGAVRCLLDPAIPYTIYYDKNTTDAVSDLPSTWNGTLNTVRNKLILSATTPSRLHHEFIGWCDTAPTVSGDTDICPGVTYMPGSELPASGSSTTVYAMWHKTEHVVTIALTGNATGVTIDSANYTTSAALATGTYTISGSYAPGYKFDSWATSGSISVASTSSATTTMTVTGAGTLTLNGKGILYFQNATSAQCGQTMYDNRGTDAYKNIAYTTASINGLCWMTRNLDLPGGTTLTADDSNVSAGCNLGGTNNCTLPASRGYDSFSDNAIAYVYNSGLTDCSWGECYSYYSYVAATAGTNPSSGEATSDICPKGWRLPTQAEYETLSNTYTTGAALTASPFYGVYAGLLDNSSLYDGGYYWSSTASNSSRAYYLIFDSSYASTEDNVKRSGLSVRCVAK